MRRLFTKLQGLGNDFILFDELAKRPNEKSCIEMTPELAIQLCDRRFGVGADGVFILRNACDQTKADISWEFYNSDGSVAEMCGNAVRCVARYIFESDLWPMPTPTLEPVVIVGEDGDLDLDSSDSENIKICCGELRIETLAGIKTIGLKLDAEGKFFGARVDMGIAELDSDIEIDGRNYARVSMGNPHAVTFVDELKGEFGTAPVSTEGPVVEVDSAFPHKTNVEFVQIMSRDRIRLRVWERGAGETLACGTGACAAVVAAYEQGLVGSRVTVDLLGGSLIIEVNDSRRVFMTGPAETVFTGKLNLNAGPCKDPCADPC